MVPCLQNSVLLSTIRLMPWGVCMIRKVFLRFVKEEELLPLTNGCGPDKWGWAVPDLGRTQLCTDHDLLYSVGLPSNDKRLVDIWFVNKLIQSGLNKTLTSLVSEVLVRTNFNRRPLGPFSRLSRGDLSRLQFELMITIISELNSIRLESDPEMEQELEYA